MDLHEEIIKLTSDDIKEILASTNDLIEVRIKSFVDGNTKDEKCIDMYDMYDMYVVGYKHHLYEGEKIFEPYVMKLEDKEIELLENYLISKRNKKIDDIING